MYRKRNREARLSQVYRHGIRQVGEKMLVVYLHSYLTEATEGTPERSVTVLACAKLRSESLLFRGMDS